MVLQLLANGRTQILTPVIAGDGRIVRKILVDYDELGVKPRLDNEDRAPYFINCMDGTALIVHDEERGCKIAARYASECVKGTIFGDAFIGAPGAPVPLSALLRHIEEEAAIEAARLAAEPPKPKRRKRSR